MRILCSEIDLQWKEERERESERERERTYVRYCILKWICSRRERETERNLM